MEEETPDLFKAVAVRDFDHSISTTVNEAKAAVLQLIRNVLQTKVDKNEELASDSTAQNLDREMLFIEGESVQPDSAVASHLKALESLIANRSDEIDVLQISGEYQIRQYFASVSTSGKGAISRIVGGAALGALGIGIAYMMSPDANFTKALDIFVTRPSHKQSLFEHGYQELGNYLALLGVGFGSISLTKGALRLWNRDVPVDHQFRLLAERSDQYIPVAIHSAPMRLEGGQYLLVSHIISWEADSTDPSVLTPKLTIIKAPHPNASEKYNDWSLKVEVSKISKDARLVKYLGRTYVFRRDNKQADYDFHVHDISDPSRPSAGLSANIRLFGTKPRFERRTITEIERQMLLAAIKESHTSMFDPETYGRPVESNSSFRDRSIGHGHRWARNLAVGAVAFGMGIWPAPIRLNHSPNHPGLSPVAYMAQWPADQVWQYFEDDMLFQMAMSEYAALKGETLFPFNFEKSSRDIPFILIRRSKLASMLEKPQTIEQIASSNPFRNFLGVWENSLKSESINSYFLQDYSQYRRFGYYSPDEEAFQLWLSQRIDNEAWYSIPGLKWEETVGYLFNAFVQKNHGRYVIPEEKYLTEFLDTVNWPDALKQRYRNYFLRDNE